MTQRQMALVEELLVKSKKREIKSEMLSEWYVKSNKHHSRIYLKNRITRAEIRNITRAELKYLGFHRKTFRSQGEKRND